MKKLNVTIMLAFLCVLLFAVPVMAGDQEKVPVNLYVNGIRVDFPDQRLELAQALAGFNDLASDHWARDYVEDLTDREVINGYPDGSFKPEGTITVEEFIKMAITSLGFTDLEANKDNWSKPYIDKAIETSIVAEGDFSNYKKNINRAEMARIIARCMEYNKEVFEGRDEYIKTIKDYNTIGSKFNDYVLKAYSKGVITGYPDGSFGADKNATRAEACTMIYRLIHEEARTPVELPEDFPVPIVQDSGEYRFTQQGVFTEEEDPYVYFRFRIENYLDFYKEGNIELGSDYEIQIKCTNRTELNRTQYYSTVTGKMEISENDRWRAPVDAGRSIGRYAFKEEGRVPFYLEPGTVLEFDINVRNEVTGEQHTYPYSLTTK